MFHLFGKGSFALFFVFLLFFHFMSLSVLTVYSYGQTPQTLTLKEAFWTALSKNPVINQALASRKRAESHVKQSISAFLPKVDLELGYSRSNNPVMVFGSKLNQAAFSNQDFAIDTLNNPDYRDDWQTRIILTQPLFNQGREYIGFKTSELMKDVSEYGVVRAGQEVLFTVESAYCQALLAQEKVDVLKLALETAKAHRKLSEKRYEAGLVLKSDVLSADVQKTATERQLFQAENDLKVATASLNKAMGISQDIFWRLKPLDNENRDGGSLEAWLKKARENRPEVLIAKDQLRIAEYNHRQAQFHFLPSFNLHGIYQQNRENFADFGGDSWTLMATMSVNLFSGFGQMAQVSASNAEMDRAAARLREVENNIELEVRKAFYGFQTAQKQLRVTRQAVEQAKEGQRILKNRYENGLALMVELLAADTSVREMMLQEAKARFDARLAWSELRWKTGILGKDMINTASSSSN